MNVLEAMKDTVALVARRRSLLPDDGASSFGHFEGMLQRMLYASRTGSPMSYGKLCRWLGWVQGAAHAHGALDLEEAKQINKDNAEDPFVPTHRHLKTGGLYRVIREDVKREDDWSDLVLYCNAEGQWMTRPYDEFHDGRFEKLWK